MKACEASMLNRFGVKAIKTFFNLPFLKMERDVIEERLQRNLEDAQLANEEYDLVRSEQDYQKYFFFCFSFDFKINQFFFIFIFF